MNSQLFLSNRIGDPIKAEHGNSGINDAVIPNWLTNNLKFGLRPYQQEAFQRFIACYQGKKIFPDNKYIHLLYNMATGSGKTVIMAGLILYLYKQGYRHFLFFVNNTNVLEKTKANFLDQTASKYLFRQQIIIGGRVVAIRSVDNFNQDVDCEIQIKFTTIQQLHEDFDNPSENGISEEDLKDYDIVLLSDEAHHLQATTKQLQLGKKSWEQTVEQLFRQNSANILLEFTATIDEDNEEIVNKYRDKIAFKYDLREFCSNQYSKDIFLLRSDLDKKGRMLQAIIINLYRQKIAVKHGINLKPVILFKAQKTIAESRKNAEYFQQLITDLTAQEIENFRKKNEEDTTQRAFVFFDLIKMDNLAIATSLRENFQKENCLDVNEKGDVENNQIRLNTLEDDDNPVRAIFAVQKLNEGWDVLNLFDIVRLYTGRDSPTAKKIGKTTLSEVQLIGRGARYYPFQLQDDQDKYRRKFDDDLYNDLRILEELHYHAKEDSRYISELRRVLDRAGLTEHKRKTKKLTVRKEFRTKLKDCEKQHEFYNTAKVFANTKQKRDYKKQPIQENIDLKQVMKIYVSSGWGESDPAYKELRVNSDDTTSYLISAITCLKDIPKHIVRYSLSKEPFFYFDNLQKLFPKLTTLSEFIDGDQYLGQLQLDIRSRSKRELDNHQCLEIADKILEKVQVDIEQDIVYEWTGSEEFQAAIIKDVFTDKNLSSGNEEQTSDEKAIQALIDKANWYLFNEYYGTPAESEFIRTFRNELYEDLARKCKYVYLVRNERHLKIYNKQGIGFQPDFLLFCQSKTGRNIKLQVFIEPKGLGVQTLYEDTEKKKEKFLQDIYKQEYKVDQDSNNHKITAVPCFYIYTNPMNKDNVEKFKTEFKNALNL